MFLGDVPSPFHPIAVEPEHVSSSSFLQEPLPFEGQSLYAADFGVKRAEPMEFAAMPPAAKPLPFEGQSTYRQEFVAKQVIFF